MRSAADPVRSARLGLLVALAVVLQVVETVLPMPVPWLRLGLGNAVVLLALHLWGGREATWVACGKVLVGGLLTGRLLSPGFFLSAAGTGAATLAMWSASRFSPPLGFVGVSLMGAEAHGLAQLALASFLLGTPAVWSLAPLVGSLCLLTGCLTGVVAARLAALLAEAPIPASPD